VTGFIGRHALAPLLARGFEVHAVYHNAPLQIDGVLWHQSDLLNEASTAILCADVRPTHLLHFAWYAVPGKYWTSPENELWVIATQDLLKAFAENGGTRAVLAGTCAEYDWTNPPEFLSEISPLASATLYGISKNKTWKWAENFAREQNISLAWGRIFLLYGPHEDPARLVPSVITSLLDGKEANTTSGEQIRDFLHVEDVASAFVSLLDSDVRGAVNIGSGSPTAVKDIVLGIADIIGRQDLVRLGALPSRPNEPARLVADTTRLSQEVGFRPRYSLREGLEKTILWWKENTARDR